MRLIALCNFSIDATFFALTPQSNRKSSTRYGRSAVKTMRFFRLLTRSLALLLIVAGAAVLSCAYLYGVFGEAANFDAPPQDAPPAVAQKYARNEVQSRQRIAQIQRTTARFNRGGTLLLGLGLGLGVVQSIVSITRRKKPHA